MKYRSSKSYRLAKTYRGLESTLTQATAESVSWAQDAPDSVSWSQSTAESVTWLS